jgi:CubicO group peptidase (beta-lactamase class C family)
LPAAASGLRLRPRDLAKFGSLYLHDGQWNGRQVVPADWVHESTRWQIALATPVSAYGTHGYGYLWWHTSYRTAVGTLEVPLASGNGEQKIFVVPELHIVVTMLAGRYNDPTATGLPSRLLLEQIVPAVRTDPEMHSLH